MLVQRPEIVQFATVDSAFGPGDRTLSRLLDVRDVLRIRRVEAASHAAREPSEGIASAA